MVFNYIRVISRYIFSGIKRSLRKKGIVGKNPFTDVVVVSYPKSGRTWIRVVMDYLGYDLSYDHDAARIAYHPEKEYKDFEINRNKYRDKRVIFIIRDPRDVSVSSYFHAVYRQKVFEGSIAEFIRSEKFGIKKIADFQKKWLSAGSIAKDFLVIRYEDIKKQPVSEFRDILDFLGGKKISGKKIKKAVELFSFDKMKKYEKNGIFRFRYGKILKPKNAENVNSYKVRRGKAGGYKDYLSASDIDCCNRIMEEFNLTEYLK